MTGKITPLRKRDTSAVQAAAGPFMSSARHTDPNTRRGYTGVPGQLLVGQGRHQEDDAGNHAELGRLNAKLSPRMSTRRHERC